ncbi:MAG: hypothetical protein V4819_10295 [Verrucomicrobiota bacterium]
MKFQCVAVVAGVSAWGWIAVAAPDVPMESSVKAPEKSLAVLIQDLSDEKYRIREEATRKIWMIGEPALGALQETAVGNDPEQAYRARELIRKIQLHVTPDTDPAVMALVERYAKATPNEKLGLFAQMHKRRAWRQILKLYATETNPEIQARLQRAIDGVAVVAARECLEDGDAAAAREFLELAPADAPGLLALADFHRSQGTLEAELKRAKTIKGVQGDAWQLALHRASGNLEAARDSATAAGEVKISAAMSALLGDPLPWLRKNQMTGDGGAIHKPYTELAIKRWQGNTLRASDLEPLVQSAKSRNRGERPNGINSLFLLGETDLAEDAYWKSSPLEAFTFFESLERIPMALKALGLDPDKPDYAGWVEKRVEQLSKEDAGEEHEASLDIDELILLANFLERRGLNEENADAFMKPLAALADKDVKVFLDFLATLFGGSPSERGATEAAPQLARLAAITWAGDNATRWDEVIVAAVGGEEETMALWDWLLVLDPKVSRVERLDGMLALCGIGRDPHKLREKWLALAWEAIRNTPEGERTKSLLTMSYLSRQCPDVATSLKVWDMLPEDERNEVPWRLHVLDLTAAGRWDEAAEFYLTLIDRLAKARQDSQPWLRANAAACLRKAGRAEEAAAQDALVEKLALGNNALEIANGYAEGCDYERAADWWARSARQSDPTTEYFEYALRYHVQTLLDQGDWKAVAAVSEVRAQMSASVDPSGGGALARLRVRLHADLGRAFANLKSDRAGALALLGNCHRLFPSDGSLADDFFPALRRMGLVKEHDEWFKISWDRMVAVLAQFPDSDNTRNTAAWLASRARRNLDQAEEFENMALAMNPDQSAYLDTMAEIQFAKGKREKALEWSSRAVNFSDPDQRFIPNERDQIRRQQERFHSAPLPR